MFYPTSDRVQEMRASLNVPYTLFLDDEPRTVQLNQDILVGSFREEIDDELILKHTKLQGYNGFGGVHDNLVWNYAKRICYFTLNNKLI